MGTGPERPLALFQGFGVELEYMIVDRDTLDVLPICDRLIHAEAGEYEAEIERDELAWSNELVLHVLELKTNGPAASLEGLEAPFASDLRHANELLAPLGARLMPTAMHPWMDPPGETRLWPHEYNAVYEAFDRIFDCRGHGWSNLQSAHLNLPFSGDEEFGRLHAAIRLVLPILPALAASSPVVDGRLTGLLDNRMEFYRHNARRIPSVTGRVIPERADSRAQYEREILGRMYREIAPHDPDGILRHEWLNARGAIARFDRDAIEIRVIDVQECPLADVAIARAVVAVLRALLAERWLPLATLREWSLAPLEKLLLSSIRDAERAEIADPGYLAAFGLADRKRCSAGELWAHLFDSVVLEGADRLAPWAGALHTIATEGTLARRVATALEAGRGVKDVYRELCDCLEQGRLFASS